jgi:hypothetical protein
MAAASTGDTKLVRDLLAAGADREARDARGHSARDIAREHEFDDVYWALGDHEEGEGDEDEG